MSIIQKKHPSIVELLVVIVNRKKGEKVAKILNNLHVDLQVLTLGHGTADSSMAEYFNMNLDEKELVFAIIKMSQSKKILAVLNEKMKFDQKNTGLAFTVPLKSATSSLVEQMGFNI